MGNKTRNNIKLLRGGNQSVDSDTASSPQEFITRDELLRRFVESSIDSKTTESSPALLEVFSELSGEKKKYSHMNWDRNTVWGSFQLSENQLGERISEILDTIAAKVKGNPGGELESKEWDAGGKRVLVDLGNGYRLGISVGTSTAIQPLGLLEIIPSTNKSGERDEGNISIHAFNSGLVKFRIPRNILQAPYLRSAIREIVRCFLDDQTKLMEFMGKISEVKD